MDGQVRNASAAADGTAAPSTSGAAASAPYSSADGDDNAGAGGAKVWVLVLLFALLLLPFLPSAMRRGGGTTWGGGGGGGGGGYRRGGINFKSGWDVVNLCLVLFAILCGLLGRGGGGGDGDGESPCAAASAAKNDRQMSPVPSTAAEAVTAATTSVGDWESYGSFSSYSSQHRSNHTGIRRMKSSSSYPELRLGSDGVWSLAEPEAAWRFYDDSELYRTRRPERQERTWDVDPHGRTPEVKTIPVDTFVERRSSPPREPRRRRRSVERLPKMAEVEEERPHINQRTWSKTVLEATAPGLEAKLGNLAPAYSVAGRIASYFVERFEFGENCLVIQWSGDNPNSLAGLTLNTPGDLAISLGTSDTVFGITAEAKPSLEGHVFPNPVEPNGYMVMLCYKNGSLTREDVRNRYAEKSWDVFNNYLEKTTPLNGGKLGFYYKDHEILPPLPVGFHRYIVENFNDVSSDNLMEREVEEFDAPSEVRAIIEGQMLSMRGHAERFGMPNPPKRIIATGGASSNESILKSIAQIFGCPVFTVQRPDSASLGAALRAAHGWLCNEEGSFVPTAAGRF